MVQYAIFLNRNATHHYFPYFEIIYCAEYITLLLDILLYPILIWIIWSAEPLHRNLRYSFLYCTTHLLILNATRIPLLLIQQYAEDLEEYSCILVIFSFARFEAFCFYSWLILIVTIERFVATEYWSWYEKQGLSTVSIITVSNFVFEIIGCTTAYLILYQDLFAPETVIMFRNCSIVVVGGLISISFVTNVVFMELYLEGYFVLIYYNNRELRKIQRRSDPNFDRYSLARTYQLRENVVIMKMLVKIIVPAFVFASPVFIFRAVTFLLPQYELFCNIIIAIVDLWVALSGLNVQLIFPFVDYRFRKTASRIPIFRFIIELRGMQTSTGTFVRKHLTGNKIQTADHYFHWLENDLK